MNNLNEIINKVVGSKYDALNLIDEKELIKSLKDNIDNNFDSFIKCNDIDLNNHNGYKIDKNKINKIIDKLLEEELLIDKNEIYQNNELLKTKTFSSIGTIAVIYDGDFYTMLELIIKSIYTHNSIIFLYEKYMLATNGLLITIIKEILKKNNYNENIIDHYYGMDFKEVYDNFKSINKTIIIGDSDFQNKYRLLCKTDSVLLSGYNNYDIYIDELNDINLLQNILKLGEKINLYINSNLNVKSNDALFVSDIDEAITMINYNGSGYATSIFTSNELNASKFFKEVKSTNILVNTSPTICSELDVTQNDLLKKVYKYVPNKKKM